MFDVWKIGKCHNQLEIELFGRVVKIVMKVKVFVILKVALRGVLSKSVKVQI